DPAADRHHRSAPGPDAGPAGENPAAPGLPDQIHLGNAMVQHLTPMRNTGVIPSARSGAQACSPGRPDAVQSGALGNFPFSWFFAKSSNLLFAVTPPLPFSEEESLA